MTLQRYAGVYGGDFASSFSSDETILPLKLYALAWLSMADFQPHAGTQLPAATDFPSLRITPL